MLTFSQYITWRREHYPEACLAFFDFLRGRRVYGRLSVNHTPT